MNRRAARCDVAVVTLAWLSAGGWQDVRAADTAPGMRATQRRPGNTGEPHAKGPEYLARFAKFFGHHRREVDHAA